MTNETKVILAKCQDELATNFDASAQAILAKYGVKLGMSARKVQELLETGRLAGFDGKI